MLEKVFTTSEVRFWFSTTSVFKMLQKNDSFQMKVFCKTLPKQMLSCFNIQQSVTPACRRDAHSFIAGPVLQPPPHAELLDTAPF